MTNHPRVLALLCLVGMWLMAYAGFWIGHRYNASRTEDKEHLALVVSATLTLLGLIIGFTFSMAATRYDQRRLYEEQEANAIGTEYVRADLLPSDQAAQVKKTLLTYLDWRISFYRSTDGQMVTSVDRHTVELQAQLWQSILKQAHATPDPVIALVVSGMNDVLNSQGYTQFSWWNRIPGSALGLMIAIAAFSNLLVGCAAPGPAHCSWSSPSSSPSRSSSSPISTARAAASSASLPSTSSAFLNNCTRGFHDLATCLRGIGCSILDS